MKHLRPFVLLVVAACLPLSLGRAAAPLRVVTTTPDLADITDRIGGDAVRVLALAKGNQNPHHVEAKPSLIVKLIDADLYIQTGFELESAWAPLLIQGSRNRSIFPGSTGFLEASSAIDPLEVPANASRSMGDVHAQGNPHFMADPANALRVSKLIANRLSELAPDHRTTFEENQKAFASELEKKMKEWDALLISVKGAPFVSYHRDWSYFAHRYGLRSAGEIEPKPGIPPTAGHTAELIKKMKAEQVRLILTDPWFEDRTSAFIARETGARVVRLALLPGGIPGTDTYLAMMEHNVRAVAEALKP